MRFSLRPLSALPFFAGSSDRWMSVRGELFDVLRLNETDPWAGAVSSASRYLWSSGVRLLRALSYWLLISGWLPLPLKSTGKTSLWLQWSRRWQIGKPVHREMARVCLIFPSLPNITVISFFSLFSSKIQGWICRQLCVCSLAAADLLCCGGERERAGLLPATDLGLAKSRGEMKVGDRQTEWEGVPKEDKGRWRTDTSTKMLPLCSRKEESVPCL